MSSYLGRGGASQCFEAVGPRSQGDVRPRANLSPGKHLAVASAGEATQLNVVVNWLQELRQRVPTK